MDVLMKNRASDVEIDEHLLEFLDYEELMSIESDLKRNGRMFCITGVLSSICITILQLIAFTIIKKLFILLFIKGLINQFLLNIAVLICAIILLHLHNASNSFPIAIFICIFFPIIFLKRFFINKPIGFLTLTYGITCVILGQYILPPEKFMSMRGTLMIILMKTSSLAFDIDNGTVEFTNVPFGERLLCFTYVVDPSNIIFGPWISFHDFKNSIDIRSFKEELLNFFIGITIISISLIFLIYSSCIVYDVFGEAFLWRNFATAQSFRFSHYFICWLSAGVSRISGSNVGDISEFYHIEWPRSLTAVVVSWNIPMHKYLHKYVFAEAQRYGTIIAILVTYMASSLLHGIDLQISAVLLSLGFYTFSEARIRDRISKKLNCCVRARKCREHCKHTFKSFSIRAMFINLLFTFLAIGHLIYLGMVFDDSSAETGYSYRHTIRIWTISKFASHFVAFTILILSYII